MPNIDVNTSELIKFTNKLDKMHSSVLPRAARNTLNSLAFDVKKKTLQDESKVFTRRRPSFYKRFSGVKMAEGKRINSMQSKAGMQDSAFGKSKEQAGENQRQQQLGGSIGGRTFIPLDSARVSGRNSKSVRSINRISKIKIAAKSSRANASGEKKRFVQTAISAIKRHGDNAIIIHKNKSGKKFLYRVKRGGSSLKTREGSLKVTPLYSVKEGRSVKVKARPFVKRAAKRSSKKGNEIFINHAKKEFSRIRK